MGFGYTTKDLKVDISNGLKGSGSSLSINERQFRWLLDGLSVEQESAHKPANQRILI